MFRPNICLPGLVIGHVSVRFRTIHSCSERLNKYAPREARIMQKLMKASSNKRKSWYNPGDNINNRPSLPTLSSIHQGHHSDRRVAVLNKLFMRHITDLMVTGEIASKILHHGIEISRVKVASDFTRVNVYWVAKGSNQCEDTEEILINYARKLRHELAQLRLMGSLPTIDFVKDKTYGVLVDVDRLLAVADYGEDYIPVDPSHHFKSEFILNTHLTPSVTEHLEVSQRPAHSAEDPLPSMRMDVLGVNQLGIMTKVKKSMKKSQALHRARSDVEPPTSTDNWIAQSEEAKQSEGNIREFLMKQQHLKRKAERGAKNYQPEYELLELEQERQGKIEFFGDAEDDDFDDMTDTENDKY